MITAKLQYGINLDLPKLSIVYIKKHFTILPWSSSNLQIRVKASELSFFNPSLAKDLRRYFHFLRKTHQY